MRKTRATHEDLVDPEREYILATLTARAWAKMSAVEARKRWYAKTPEQIVAEGYLPMDEVIHAARQSSGSIGGAHRRDLVEAMRVSTQPQAGLSLNVAEAQGDDARDEKGKEKRREKRRGL